MKLYNPKEDKHYETPEPASRWKQWRCKHKNVAIGIKCAAYLNLSGDRWYAVCMDCGKELETRFYPNADGS